MSKGDEFASSNPNVLFDLRQTYAIYILTPILVQLEEFKETNEFEKWYEKLTTSLYTNIYQKLTEEEREEYLQVNKNCVEVLNKYPFAYAGRNKENKEIYLIKKALLNLEMWLKEKMELHGLFGKGGGYDWDEI